MVCDTRVAALLLTQLLEWYFYCSSVIVNAFLVYSHPMGWNSLSKNTSHTGINNSHQLPVCKQFADFCLNVCIETREDGLAPMSMTRKHSIRAGKTHDVALSFSRGLFTAKCGSNSGVFLSMSE